MVNYFRKIVPVSLLCAALTINSFSALDARAQTEKTDIDVYAGKVYSVRNPTLLPKGHFHATGFMDSGRIVFLECDEDAEALRGKFSVGTKFKLMRIIEQKRLALLKLV